MLMICTPDVDHPVVSIQGVKGSFHHHAAEGLFGKADFLQRDNFPEVFEDVSEERAHYALVAIENSIAGSLLRNYDLLAASGLQIIGEAFLRIEHHLIAHDGVTLEEIREVWSHPMAIAQTHDFLSTIDARVLEKKDTAGAVQFISENDLLDVAAIGSERAARLFGMSVMRPNIETDPHNYTRFLLLAGGHTVRTEKGYPLKTSIQFSVANEPGALAHYLQAVADAGFNMTKIESRPRVGAPWEYDFFMDLQVEDAARLEALLRQLEPRGLFLKNLGSYPCFGYVE